MIEEGTAEAHATARRRRLRPGDFFGEMASRRERAHLTAKSPMKVIVMTRSSFRALDKSVPKVHKAVHDAIAERRATAR